MSLALDVSNYGTVPTPMQLDCLKSSGYTRAIVGCSDGTIANMQLAAYYAAGMEVEAYCWVSYGQFWTAKVDHALNVLKTARGVARMWLDVESDKAISGIDPTISQMEARINAVITYITLARPDLELGIYTSRGWWTGHGDLHTFCAMPLFTAEYVEDATVPPTGGPTLYGGWTKAAMWQYAGTIDTCGLSVDRSVILEDEVTDDDLRKISDVVKLNLAVAPLNDTQKQEAGDIVKIQLELFRQELEKAGQLPPRVP